MRLATTTLNVFILVMFVASMVVCALVAVDVAGSRLGVPVRHTGPNEPISWTDPVTKCEFLIAPTGGITPRLNTFGQPICADTMGVDYE